MFETIGNTPKRNDLAPSTYRWGSQDIQRAYMVSDDDAIIIEKSGNARKVTIDEFALGNSNLKNHFQPSYRMATGVPTYKRAFVDAVHSMAI